MAGVALEVAGLTRRFGGHVAVRELSFVARQGEIVGLLGPNKAGKTTAIRVLSAVMPPSSGEFAVAGVPHSRPIVIRRRIRGTAGEPPDRERVFDTDHGAELHVRFPLTRP